MLSNAAALAILTTGGFAIVFNKLPRKVRKFILKHSLAADIVALLLTYVLLGGTLTALTAAALVGLMTSALIHIQNHRSEYEWLFDFGDAVKDKLNSFKQFMLEKGREYRQRKLEAAGVV